MKKIPILAILIFGFAGTVFALPYFSSTQTMIPFVDSSYDIGTTTLRYRNLYVSGTIFGATISGSNIISTSSPLTSGQPIYATGWNTLASVASSTFLTSIGGQPAGNYATFSYPFPSNATTTNITFSNGLTGTLTGNADTVTNGVYTTGAGTVFLAPSGSAASLTDFPTLNQNTSGTAASLSAILANTLGGTGKNSSAFTGLAGISSGSWYAIATSSVNMNITGLAGTATALATARAINGVNFDGTAPITIASTTLLADVNTWTNTQGMSITGNSATVTTNANLSGAVTSSGSNVTAFGTMAQGILGNPASAATIPTALATSTLYGAIGTANYGQQLAWNGSAIAWMATSTLFSWNGTGLVVRDTSPSFTTPALGTPSALVGTNITGTGANFTAGNVTTNANLTGVVTSVGNATSWGTLAKGNFLVGNDSNIGQATSTIFISSAGNVGIGTTGPLVKLDVLSSGSVIRASDGTAKVDIYVSQPVGGIGMATANHDFRVYVDNDLTKGITVLHGGGNVGIGTTAPTAGARLDIRPQTTNAGVLIYNDTTIIDGASVPLWLASKNSASSIYNVSIENAPRAGAAADMVFRTGANSAAGFGTTAMTILGSTGNVGIGTTTPFSKFQVTSGASATTTVNFGEVGASGSHACFNTKNTAGGDISFYFIGTTMQVENNLCRP